MVMSKSTNPESDVKYVQRKAILNIVIALRN